MSAYAYAYVKVWTSPNQTRRHNTNLVNTPKAQQKKNKNVVNKPAGTINTRNQTRRHNKISQLSPQAEQKLSIEPAVTLKSRKQTRKTFLIKPADTKEPASTRNYPNQGPM